MREGLQGRADLATRSADAITTSAIEGERLDPDEVRSSVARRIGMDAAGLPMPGRAAEAIVAVLTDATRRADESLTPDRLRGWHALLFEGHRGMTIGAWRRDDRDPMRVVSGAMGKERVHFEAPAASRLENEIGRFVEWFNGDSAHDPVIRAAIAHLWFVTLHPFDDGNGRIARAVADMMLARADGSNRRYYSMSAQIQAERESYYRVLERTQRGGLDITGWIAWFLGCLGRAIDGADGTIGAVLRAARVWEIAEGGPLNERQRLVIGRMCDGWKGHMTTSKYATLAKCSTDTALRDIRELTERGVLVWNEKMGRGANYRLAVG